LDIKKGRGEEIFFGSFPLTFAKMVFDSMIAIQPYFDFNSVGGYHFADQDITTEYKDSTECYKTKVHINQHQTHESIETND
jgi:hypothetical protein